MTTCSDQSKFWTGLRAGEAAGGELEAGRDGRDSGGAAGQWQWIPPRRIKEVRQGPPARWMVLACDVGSLGGRSMAQRSTARPFDLLLGLLGWVWTHGAVSAASAFLLLCPLRHLIAAPDGRSALPPALTPLYVASHQSNLAVFPTCTRPIYPARAGVIQAFDSSPAGQQLAATLASKPATHELERMVLHKHQ